MFAYVFKIPFWGMRFFCPPLGICVFQKCEMAPIRTYQRKTSRRKASPWECGMMLGFLLGLTHAIHGTGIFTVIYIHLVDVY